MFGREAVLVAVICVAATALSSRLESERTFVEERPSGGRVRMLPVPVPLLCEAVICVAATTLSSRLECERTSGKEQTNGDRARMKDCSTIFLNPSPCSARNQVINNGKVCTLCGRRLLLPSRSF